MRIFEYIVKIDYGETPTIIRVGAKDQFEALRKLVDKLESENVIGNVKNIEWIKG